MSIANFKVYKSSAGSGKTFTLVKDFLKICLSSTDYYRFSRILAITFTNKATYEMKSRILQYLKEISTGEGGVMEEKLLDETKLSPIQLKEKCQTILKAILHNYSDFSISTIDRFTHKLIRTFSKDLELPNSFVVELDEESLLRAVIDELIDSIGKNKELTDLILKFTFFRIEEEKGWRVDQELLLFAKSILKEKASPYLKELRKNTIQDFDELISLYGKEVSALENKVKRMAEEAFELINKHQISSSSFPGRSKLDKYYEKLMRGEMDNIHPSNELKKNVEEENWYSSKCSEDQKAAIDKVKPQLLDIFNDLQQLVEKEMPSYWGMKEVLKSIHSLALLNHIEKEFSKLKKEERILNISDFNRIISKVVMNEPMPFIYERLGEHYQHIMIDEFQDTSVLQFVNLLPLLEDSLSKGNENLIVGDAKQAIYRFRGGEVEQFAQMPDFRPNELEELSLFDERMRALKSQYNKQVLNYNYRSLSNIINFNNEFFEFSAQVEGFPQKLKDIYQEHKQEIIRESDEGYVELLFVEGKSKKEKREVYETEVYNRIQDCISDGYQLNDIAILFRKSKQAEEMASYLKENGVEVVSSEALKLNNNAGVHFLINVTKWIVYPSIHLYQKEIIEYLHQKDSLDEALNTLFEEYIGEQYELGRMFERLGYKINRKSIALKPPIEFFEYLIQQFQLNKEYPAYLQALQEEVMDYSKNYRGTIMQFLEWWDENNEKLAIDIPDKLNAIRLLTIHKSKGLEFPIVIYPYADQRIEHSSPFKKEFIWTSTAGDIDVNIPYTIVEFSKKLSESNYSIAYQKELEKKQIDLINLTYVAFTRAGQRLYILSESPSSSSLPSNSLSSLLNSFVSQSTAKEHNGMYSFGEVNKKKGENDEEQKLSAENEIDMEYLSSPWREKLVISKTVNNGSQEQKYGLLMHEILSKLNDRGEIAKVLKQYLLDGYLTEEEEYNIKTKLDRLMSRPDVQPYFDTKYRNRREASLLSSKGEVLRPDRIIYLDDRVVVLDYKTGEPKEKDKEQLRNYVEVLEEMYALPTEGYLLYLEKEELLALN